MNILNNGLQYADVCLLLVNVVLYGLLYSKNKELILGIFTAYLITTFVILSLSILIIEVFDFKNNLFLSHFYFISQFIFISLFYKQLFTHSQSRWVTYTLWIVLSILIVQYIWNFELFYRFNLLEIFMTSFPLIVYSIIHLFNSLTNKNRFMYINAGVLFYLSVSTLIFFLGNYIGKIDGLIVSGYWNLNEVFYVLNRVFYVSYLILLIVEWKKAYGRL